MIRPALTEVRLDKWTGTAWQGLAQAGSGPDPAAPDKVYGSWMPVPPETGSGTGPGQTKLRVWSKTPFSFSRHTGSAWTDQFVSLYPNYPCIDVPSDRRICCDFSGYNPGDRPSPPWACKGNDAFFVTWGGPPAPTVEAHGDVCALCFPPGGSAVIVPTAAVKELLVEVATGQGDQEQCLDFRGRVPSKAANPRQEGGYEFTVYRNGGALAEATEIRLVPVAGQTTASGLECGIELRCDLPTTSSSVRVLLSSANARTVVTALNTEGGAVARQDVGGISGIADITLESAEAPIARVVVSATESGSALLHEICSISGRPGVVVIDTLDGAGRIIASQRTDPDAAAVSGVGAARFVVHGEADGPFCLVRVCAVFGPGEADRLGYGLQAQHVVDELARWQADDVVLPPYSTLRLKLVTSLGVQLPVGSGLPGGFGGTRTITQVAYFRTEGPPGLAALANAGTAHVPGAGSGAPQDPPVLQTGLEDLARYVAQTIPATVTTEGSPKITRPVYRGYDVGVAFTINYVDLMYALAGRDLALALYDTNDRPVRDSRGLILTIPNRWGRTDTLSLSESEQRWLDVLDRARCTGGSIDLGTVTHNKAAALSGFVLDPVTTYEGRLVPQLAADSFDGYGLGATASRTGAVLSGNLWSWTARDQGAVGGPSFWRVAATGTPVARFVQQTSSLYGGPAVRNDPFPGGALLLLNDVARLPAGGADQPSQWTDYRLAGFVRSAIGGILGFGVRMSGRSGYLVKLDQQRNLRQLVLLSDSGANVLVQADGGYALDTDTHVSVEAVGNRLRVHIDGGLAFDITDGTRPAGTVALYAANNAGARFTDVRVDHLRKGAPVVYRFKFTTSASPISAITCLAATIGSGPQARTCPRLQPQLQARSLRAAAQPGSRPAKPRPAPTTPSN